MNHTFDRIRSGRAAAQGVAMIEVLIGMLLIALWLLSTAGMQANSLKFQKGAQSRLTAIAAAVELSERMEANASAARAGDYAVSITDTAYTGSSSQMDSGTTNCETAACSPSALAAYDLAQWTTRLTQSLILKEATVALVEGAPIEATYTITIAWDEPRGRQTYADTNSKTERMSVTMTKVVRNG